MAGYVVRIALPDRPGALGLVASRIGAVGGDIVAINILERDEGHAVDEFVVEIGGRSPRRAAAERDPRGGRRRRSSRSGRRTRRRRRADDVGADVRAVHEVGDAAHRGPGERVADEGELARAGLGEPVGHGEDGAVVLGDAPAAVGEPLGLGQVAVLVEDGGQRGDLLVEGEVRGAGQGAGDAPPASLLEELVDLAGARTAQIAE